MRAVSVRVNEVIGVAGYVLPGTRVDVLATASPTNDAKDMTTKVVLANVQVLTAGTRMEQDQKDGKPVQVTVVTMSVSPEQAERLALASTEGKIQLALRNPLDQSTPATPGMKQSVLLGMARASAPVQTTASAKPSGRLGGDGRFDRAGLRAHRRNDSRRRAQDRSHQMTTDISRTTHSELESEDLNMLAAHTTQFWRSRPLQGRRPAAFFAALVVYIIVILVAAPQAQQPVFNPTGAASATVVRDAVSGSDIDLMVGRSTVLNIGSAIARVSLTVPDIADALVTSPSQLLIHGKKPGTISMFVWDKAGAISTFEVKVRHDLSALAAQLKQLFPGEEITVLGSGKDVVISGTVSSKYVIEKAADVAGGYVAKKEDVVNMLKQQEGVASNQVMLRVRFAEVSRSAMQELGVSMFANGSGSSDQWYGRSAPSGAPGPNFEDGKLVFSDFLNLFVFNGKENLGAVVKALSNKGLFQSLAEPNLIATNGKEASFLAGGEYPYPVVQSGSGTNSVTITFKEFGVRLSFTPTVLGGDLVHLKVKPEVSSLDFANAVVIDGFRVPALSTRRTETEVELRDGQTFAIAGLMNNTLTSSMSKIPGIGDIPILGLLFKSKAHQKNQTELVVMITPTIIKKGRTGRVGGPAVARRAVSRAARQDASESRSLHRFAALSRRSPEAA